MGNDQPNSTAKEDVLKQYERLLLHENQFNTHIAEIRKIASAWLLADMGAMAYILKGAQNGILNPLDQSMILLVGLLGAIGLGVLWIMDRLVYAQLLDATIFLALKMEQDHANELPQIRSTILAYSSYVGSYISAYYYVPVTALVFTACLFKFNALIAIVAAAGICTVMALASRPKKFSDMAALGDDMEFAAYLRILESAENKIKMNRLLTKISCGIKSKN
ncbi:MAG: hypothetical protein KKC76_13720 [Proteobacteria bacterium]|nr:hypothetical protein [Pseudomonadota bacterium]MBU4297428.1 hypothetical protein [Pseudomonadota bacterium]MCG2746059.1 hypothetical protein [Desulfobulbaceae bacterium]